MDYPNRKYPRLDHYDYSLPGYYYVTIHTANNNIHLSKIVEGQEGQAPHVRLFAAGQIVQQQLFDLPRRYPNVQIDKYVIMPTHIHLILHLLPMNGERPTLTQIIGAYKSLTTRACNQQFGLSGEKLFQRSFYETVLRNEQAYQECWRYIDDNPAKWCMMNKPHR